MRYPLRFIPILGAAALSLLPVCQAGPGHARPTDAQSGGAEKALSGHDSVARAVKTLMRTYISTLDSSLKEKPFGLDSLGIPDIRYTLTDSGPAQPGK